MTDISCIPAQQAPRLPFWTHLTETEKVTVSENCFIQHFEKNGLIGGVDTACMGAVFVLQGGIRVSLISEEGREVTLYRLSENDCCVTTASCVIRQITFETVASATEETDLLVIPTGVFAGLAESNIYVRAFLYELETERFSQAIWVLQQILFRRFDQRLAAFFLDYYRSTGSSDLNMTQEEIARNVNSAREVVARMLRQFSADGLVEIRRGHILLLDISGLQKIAE